MPEKYQDEIEEILRKAGEVAPTPSAAQAPERHPEDRPRESREVRDSTTRPRAPVPDYRPSPRRWAITPGKLMLAGLITLLIGIKLTPLIWIGLAMLAGAYLMYFVSPRSISYEKRWRGRPVDDVPESAWDVFRRRRKK